MPKSIACTVVYNEYTDTIRIMPQNYLLMKRGSHGYRPWQIDADLAAPLGIVHAAVDCYMQHGLRTGTPVAMVQAINARLQEEQS